MGDKARARSTTPAAEAYVNPYIGTYNIVSSGAPMLRELNMLICDGANCTLGNGENGLSSCIATGIYPGHNSAYHNQPGKRLTAEHTQAAVAYNKSPEVKQAFQRELIRIQSKYENAPHVADRLIKFANSVYLKLTTYVDPEIAASESAAEARLVERFSRVSVKPGGKPAVRQKSRSRSPTS
jgi:hypothetical protein